MQVFFAMWENFPFLNIASHCKVDYIFTIKTEGGGEMNTNEIRDDIYRMTELIDEVSDLYRIRRLCYWLLHRD